MTYNSEFMIIVASLEDKFQELITATPVKYGDLPRHLPKRAIYLFSRGTEHLYVGRTNNLRRRLRDHCSPSATHKTAAFAFKIARELTGNLKASYSHKGSRSDLCQDPVFSSAFQEAKRQLREDMDIRFIQEDDPITQALFEIYVSLALKTPYNDFDNH
jgi:hypothetical protein